MARHGENIHKRKDGRWEGRYIKGRSETGKAIWGYVYAYSYVDAKSALIRKKVKAADYTVPLGAQELTFSVLSELWLSTLNDLEESSIAHYRYSIEHYILPVIGSSFRATRPRACRSTWSRSRTSSRTSLPPRSARCTPITLII